MKNKIFIFSGFGVIILLVVWYFSTSNVAKGPVVNPASQVPVATPTPPTSAELLSPSVTPTASLDNQSAVGEEMMTPQIQEVVIIATNFKYDKQEVKVRQGDKVRLIFKNAEGFHDLVIDEFNVKTQKLEEGKQETLEFVANRSGTFEFYCSVGSHRQMGMVGKLIVE